MILKKIFEDVDAGDGRRARPVYDPLCIIRDDWRWLVRGSSLQKVCNLGGFNVDPSRDDHHAAARIGFVANEYQTGEANAACFSPDAYIGMGGYVNQCWADATNAVGAVGINSTACGATADGAYGASIRTTAYVMVRSAP